MLTARRERLVHPWTPHGRGCREEQQPTWKKPGGMGPPGIPSFGGMFPSTGLGAAAALCREQNQDKHVGFELEFRSCVKAFQSLLFAHLPLSTRCFNSAPQRKHSPILQPGVFVIKSHPTCGLCIPAASPSEGTRGFATKKGRGQLRVTHTALLSNWINIYFPPATQADGRRQCSGRGTSSRAGHGTKGTCMARGACGCGAEETSARCRAVPGWEGGRNGPCLKIADGKMSLPGQ